MKDHTALAEQQNHSSLHFLPWNAAGWSCYTL